MKSYCTQNNGDCATCSLVNYGLDCANNPLEVSQEDTEYDQEMMAAYDGFTGAATVKHVQSFIPGELFEALTGRQIGMVMSAVNKAYHAGRDSTGAEMIDTDAVYIKSLDKVIEITDAASALGKLGGSARTEAKANASRENGKKGGRPRKEEK